MTKNSHVTFLFVYFSQHNPLDWYNAQSYVVGDAQPSCCGLENHHSHFLLFDDHRSLNSPSGILSKRAQLEKSLQSYSSENEEKIPLVLILVEGGVSSVRTICEALLEKTPVLVIDVSSSIRIFNDSFLG